MCPISDHTSVSGEVSLRQTLAQNDDVPSLRTFIPASDLCTSAFNLAEKVLSKAILNHSVRVYMFAKWLAEQESSAWASDHDNELLFISCICHDMGTADVYDGDQRFEVEGADAAVTHLRSNGISESKAHQVWTAIALHTSPGIAERISTLARYLRLAVLIDFRAETRFELGAKELAERVETQIPRLNIEKVLGDTVVSQALSKPKKAPKASWPGVLLRAHLENPTWGGINQGF